MIQPEALTQKATRSEGVPGYSSRTTLTPAGTGTATSPLLDLTTGAGCPFKVAPYPGMKTFGVSRKGRAGRLHDGLERDQGAKGNGPGGRVEPLDGHLGKSFLGAVARCLGIE